MPVIMAQNFGQCFAKVSRSKNYAYHCCNFASPAFPRALSSTLVLRDRLSETSNPAAHTAGSSQPAISLVQHTISPYVQQRGHQTS